jgi:hypothetical protein
MRKLRKCSGFANCVPLPAQDKEKVKCYKFTVIIKTIVVKVCLILEHEFIKDETQMKADKAVTVFM